MNYAAHYERLIARARARMLTGYRERHHVIPRCMGGTNRIDNIVELTAAEHYVAHLLLVYVHPDRPGLAHAAVLMSARGKRKGNKVYAAMVEKLRRVKTPEHRRRISEGKKGKLKGPMKAETRAKLSAASKGKPKPFSPAHLAAVRAANIGRDRSGRRHTPEELAKMRAAQMGNKKWLGRRHRPETLAKMSAARIAYWQQKRGAN